MNLEKRPTWELKKIVKALSSLRLLNTEEEEKRLIEAKKILKLRKVKI
jgi:hypothetical protein